MFQRQQDKEIGRGLDLAIIREGPADCRPQGTAFVLELAASLPFKNTAVVRQIISAASEYGPCFCHLGADSEGDFFARREFGAV